MPGCFLSGRQSFAFTTFPSFVHPSAFHAAKRSLASIAESGPSYLRLSSSDKLLYPSFRIFLHIFLKLRWSSSVKNTLGKRGRPYPPGSAVSRGRSWRLSAALLALKALRLLFLCFIGCKKSPEGIAPLRAKLQLKLAPRDRRGRFLPLRRRVAI